MFNSVLCTAPSRAVTLVILGGRGCYFAELLSSEFFLGIIGDKQLGDTRGPDSADPLTTLASGKSLRLLVQEAGVVRMNPNTFAANSSPLSS